MWVRRARSPSSTFLTQTHSPEYTQTLKCLYRLLIPPLSGLLKARTNLTKYNREKAYCGLEYNYILV